MIQLQKYTPEVYYNQSRDFQFIGRLYDLVLNSIKTNSELLYNLPLNDNADKKLIDLLTMSLGFTSKHNYNTRQLIALCSTFPEIMRNKGTTKALDLACKTLLNAEGIDSEFTYSINDNNIQLFIPRELSDLNLLKDLLNYILPAGITCTIARNIVKNAVVRTQVDSVDEVKYTVGKENLMSDNKKGILIKPDTFTVEDLNLDMAGTFINATVPTVNKK